MASSMGPVQPTLFFTWVIALCIALSASAVPLQRYPLVPRALNASCTNSASNRSCWDGTYDINTNYYTDIPDTGRTVEYSFNLENVTLSPDGVPVQVLAVNGQLPGPTIYADWGDTIVVHVTNNLENNGTAIHWHGMRQFGNNAMDGVPSVTQCPISPGQSFTYTFKAEQYGTSWYHSHFAMQAWDGVAGAIVINGPATANYDEDIGSIILSDWSHISASTLAFAAETRGPPTQTSGLINGTNNYQGIGSWFETSFEKGKKYRIRLVNSAVDATFKFGIDGHKLTVIAADLVPVTPYETDLVTISNGQRYDLIVEATDPEGVSDYWIRSFPQTSCSAYNQTTAYSLIRGVLRYDTSSTADPTTSPITFTDSCIGEEANLKPWLPLNVGPDQEDENLAVSIAINPAGLFRWSINDVSMVVQWDDPTLKQIDDGNTAWTNTSNVYELPDANEWVYVVIETVLPIPHPIHLHGHDFFVLGSGTGTYAKGTPLNTNNPPRRDTTMLPGNGYVVIAFYTDNPGVWLMHCHIGWHTSEGFAVQWVERLSEVQTTIAAEASSAGIDEVCSSWTDYVKTSGLVEADSGI